MRRARNMAGPGLGKVSSTLSMIILSRLFPVASAKSKLATQELADIGLADIEDIHDGFVPIPYPQGDTRDWFKVSGTAIRPSR